MATEIVFNHMADAKNEYVVVDMTAGADAFSTDIP
jgi:CO dehydrogenase nickel-insertion accessory protein CooC1